MKISHEKCKHDFYCLSGENWISNVMSKNEIFRDSLVILKAMDKYHYICSLKFIKTFSLNQFSPSYLATYSQNVVYLRYDFDAHTLSFSNKSIYLKAQFLFIILSVLLFNWKLPSINVWYKTMAIGHSRWKYPHANLSFWFSAEDFVRSTPEAILFILLQLTYT